MSYKPSTSACDLCGNAIEDGEQVACYGCYESLKDSLQDAESTIQDLRDEIAELERELEGLTNEA